MFVIFPADELLLMTYGAAAIPRISQRPTLDCLREPQVPIVYPAHFKTKTKTSINPIGNHIAHTSGNNSSKIIYDLPEEPELELETDIVEPPVFTTAYASSSIPNSLISTNQPVYSLPPRPPQHTPRSSLKRSTPVAVKRGSIRNETFLQSPTPASYISSPVEQINYKYPIMQQSQQQLPVPNAMPSSLETTRISAGMGRGMTDGAGVGLSGNPGSYYNENALMERTRSRSPSILIEPATPTRITDPTQPIFGPGWGRPMSPMDLPPEPNKSPTGSRSRLRPKLHLPLGRLGRSSSSEHRESSRLREDLHLQVENPIFNSENLRQRNFDAFFESGEPVYKLHPTSPMSAPADSSSISSYSPPALDKYAGVYDSSPRGRGASSGGGYFAKSKHEECPRSKSIDKYDATARDKRAVSVSGDGAPQKDFSGKSSGGRKNRRFFGWRAPRGGSLDPKASMASYNGVLKDYGHNSYNEAFKSQNNVNFKLIKTVSDFTETLAQLYEEHATALQTLVSNYRKKTGELRKERPACHMTIFQAWETFLQEVETDSQASNDVASVLSRQVSRPMLDKSFHRKVQSRKIFTHRESFETIIAKTEEKLSKCRLDYKQCYVTHRQNPTQLSLSEYIDAHNAYVQQLHATNAMLESYHCDTLPQLMQELEEIHNDLCSITADSILQGADVIANKASDQAKRYSNLTTQCNAVVPAQDLSNFVRVLPLPTQASKVPRRAFAPPVLQPEGEDGVDDVVPILRNELVFDRHSTILLRSALESLKRESLDLEVQIRQLQDAVDALNRTQARGLEGQLYNKINELQEDLSLKKFDLRTKQLHLAAIRAQKDLFVSKVDPGSPRGERKLSAAATAPSMKTKWLKAFRSLKPASGTPAPADRRNGAAGTSSQTLRANDDGSHHLQEYTYKKITACDVCSQILRGHTRQGLRCRICKLNAHGDCAPNLPTRCQPKQKLLRRQKSTSEIENRVDVDDERLQRMDEVQEEAANEQTASTTRTKLRPFMDRIAKLEITDIDQIYRVLKQAGELKSANIAAEKSVQSTKMEGAPDIAIINVPDYPERKGAAAISGGSGAATAASNPVLIGRAGRGIRPPPVNMPILGVQLQQQELQQQRGGGGGGLSGLASIVTSALPVPTADISSSSAPHSPRRQKLNLRMKSLSLDSPESTELHGQMRRRQIPTVGPTTSTVSYYHGGSGGHLEHVTPPSNNSRLHSPSSPSHVGRKLLYAGRGMRGGSVDLPDEVEKSQSSASTSPCPSPVRQVQKSHRLLPTNLYVILYNFKARHADELDLKAGYKVTVIDTSDPDWWKGKVLGRVGFFPSKYCVRLNANEKPLQVTHNLQVSDGERGDSMTLLRDQIVIQTGDEVNGMVMVRSADNRQGYCPIKYLQEV